MGTKATAKKSCCQSKPRCRRCPVVLKRLADAGLAERVAKRTYRLSGKIGKKDLKAARSPR